MFKVPPAATRGFALWQAAMRWQRAVDTALRPRQLTHTQYLVLATAARAVAEQGDAIAQLVIARSAGLDRATTSTLVQKLETRGLVERSVDGADARKWRVTLTRRGWAELEKATALVEAAAKKAAPGRGFNRHLAAD